MLAPNSYIPLFPLKVVLFPGMMLPLHIFEERYKVMIQERLASDCIFGVVLARSRRAQAPNVIEVKSEDIHRVGTTAHIKAVEHLQDGQMNLITVGQDRFVVKDIYPSADDFLMGQVDPLVLEDDNPGVVLHLTQKLRPLVKLYIQHLGNVSGEDLSDASLPADPGDLAFLAGAALQGPLPDKQQLLSSDSLTELIAKTTSVLDREEQILAYMLKAYHAHQQIQRLPFVDYSLN